MAQVTRMRRTATFDSLVEVDQEMVAKFVELARQDRGSHRLRSLGSLVQLQLLPLLSLVLSLSLSLSLLPQPPQSRPPPRYSDYFYFTPVAGAS